MIHHNADASKMIGELEIDKLLAEAIGWTNVEPCEARPDLLGGWKPGTPPVPRKPSCAFGTQYWGRVPNYSTVDYAALNWLKALPGRIYWDISRFMNLKTNKVVYSVCTCWDWDDGKNGYIQVLKSDGEHISCAAALVDAVVEKYPAKDYAERWLAIDGPPPSMVYRIKPALLKALNEKTKIK
jgi:hypothetical protein